MRLDLVGGQPSLQNLGNPTACNVANAAKRCLSQGLALATVGSSRMATCLRYTLSKRGIATARVARNGRRKAALWSIRKLSRKLERQRR